MEYGQIIVLVYMAPKAAQASAGFAHSDVIATQYRLLQQNCCQRGGKNGALAIQDGGLKVRETAGLPPGCGRKGWLAQAARRGGGGAPQCPPPLRGWPPPAQPCRCRSARAARRPAPPPWHPPGPR